MSTMEDKKTKKSKKIEEVLEPTKQTNNDTMEEKPKKSRAKKTEVKEEVSEVEEKPKKSRAKKTEVKEEVNEVEEKPKKSRAKKTEVKEEVKEEVSEVEEKPKKSRAKKTEVKEVVKEEVSEVEEKPKKSRAKKTEVKEVVSEVEEKPKKSRAKKTEVKELSEVEDTPTKVVKAKQTTETKDCYIQQSEIDCLLSFSQKCKTSIVSHYDTIIDNISKMQKDVKSIDTIRSSTNDIYKNMFDILSNNNLLINHIHNLHTNFVIAANSKLTKEQYLEITKECCANIDRLRDTYINNADQHNDCLTKLYVQLNEFLESLQNTNFKLDKPVKNVINSDSENSDTNSDKLDAKKQKKPTKSLKLEKSIIKSESESDSD